MRKVDTSLYTADAPPPARHITPEEIDLSGLPRISKPEKPPILVEAPLPPPPERTNADQTVRNSERFSVRFSERTEFRTENRTVNHRKKRRTRRYSFEFYEDQVERLKQLHERLADAGDNVSLSDLAREAFDSYLEQEK